MVRSALITAALITSSLFAASAQAGDSRLMIVDRDNGRVIYDDGRNDLFCATRTVLVGYNYYGRPVYRRTMRCR